MTVAARTRLLLVAAPLALLPLSCTSATEDAPPGIAHAVAHGTVRTAAGAPVEGARVFVVLYPERCGEGFAEPADQENGPALTGASGSFETHFVSRHGPYPAVCMRVTARRGAGAALDSAWAESNGVALRGAEREPPRVRVDLVFP